MSMELLIIQNEQMPNSFSGQSIKQGKEKRGGKKRKYTFKYIKLQTKMDFKRVYSPEEGE